MFSQENTDRRIAGKKSQKSMLKYDLFSNCYI